MSVGGDNEFRGTERYEVARRIGAGGMGIVYDAFDKERGGRVALKAMLNADAALLYKFKREFRSLADVVHPNLIGLYELHAQEDRWFFTMELIEGCDFIEYVRLRAEEASTPEPDELPTIGGEAVDASTHATPAAEAIADMATVAPSSEADAEVAQLPTISPGADPNDGVAQLPTIVPSAPGAVPDRMMGSSTSTTDVKQTTDRIPTVRFPRQFHVGRLRDAMRQLAEGVAALHAAGKLHCDLKPSNVLVDTGGRVVVLDFGLVTDLSDSGRTRSHVEGTPAYMSPEQARGTMLTEASDWYGVGALMYVGLTGQLPFSGHPAVVMRRKLKEDPPKPSELTTGVPDDLERLCMDLLRRRATDRPTAIEVLRRIGGPSKDTIAPRAVSRGDAPAVLGRERELHVLDDAMSSVEPGHPVNAYVIGRSGMGKSTLVNHFLDRLERTRFALVLRGRCYERENVPFKVFDDLVDGLSQHLLELPKAQRRDLLPPNLSALATIFAVMKPLMKDAPESATQGEIDDPQERRRAGFAALRELLRRLGECGPLVLYIDDLHWGDVDSVPLFLDLLRPPDPPALLLLSTYRAEERDRSEVLGELFDERSGLRRTVDVREVNVDPLSPEKCAELVEWVTSPREREIREMAGRIAAEAAGVPLFVHELVQHVRARRELAWDTSNDISFAGMLRWRIGNLRTSATRLLEVIAVAGRPLAEDVALAVAGIPKSERAPLTELRSATLVKVHAERSYKEVEPYHDQIRESVAAGLVAERVAEIHLGLARQLEKTADPDPVLLAEHYRAAGVTADAARYAEQAAKHALGMLAFDRAAALFGLVLELMPDHPNRTDLLVARADALYDAGQVARAADVLEEAAASAEDLHAIDLYRRSAEYRLVTGHTEEGMAAFKRVSEMVGISWPGSALSAVCSFVFEKAVTRTPPDDELGTVEVSALDRLRCDIALSATRAMGVIDMTTGLRFIAYHGRHSAKLKDPRHTAASAMLNITFASLSGGPNTAKVDNAIVRARALAARVDQADIYQLFENNVALSYFLYGRYTESLDHFERAAAYVGSGGETRTEGLRTKVFILRCHWHLGQLERINERVWPWLKGAAEQGDVWGTCAARASSAPLVHLMRDDPDAAHREAERAVEDWSATLVEVIRLWAYNARIDAFIYEGRGKQAFAHYVEHWPQVKKAPMMRAQWTRVLEFDANARAALAAVASGDDGARSAAKKWIRKLSKEKSGWGHAVALQLQAASADVFGAREEAARLCVEAEAQLQEAGLAFRELIVRRSRHRIEGDDDAVAEIEATLQGMGVADPAKFADTFHPRQR